MQNKLRLRFARPGARLLLLRYSGIRKRGEAAHFLLSGAFCYYFLKWHPEAWGIGTCPIFGRLFATTLLSGIRKRGEPAHVLFSGAFLLLLY